MPPNMLVGRQDFLKKMFANFEKQAGLTTLLLTTPGLPTHILCRQSYLPTNIFGGISAASSGGLRSGRACAPSMLVDNSQCFWPDGKRTYLEAFTQVLFYTLRACANMPTYDCPIACNSTMPFTA